MYLYLLDVCVMYVCIYHPVDDDDDEDGVVDVDDEEGEDEDGEEEGSSDDDDEVGLEYLQQENLEVSAVPQVIVAH